MPGSGAITFGNTILYNNSLPSEFTPRYNQTADVNLGLHEKAHTYQYQRWGPFYLPIYLGNGGISARNPFENSADDYAQRGGKP